MHDRGCPRSEQNMTVGQESQSCFERASGEPLIEYESLRDAQEGAEQENEHQQKEKVLIPYRCSFCHKWHVSPQDMLTPAKSYPLDSARKDSRQK